MLQVSRYVSLCLYSLRTPISDHWSASMIGGCSHDGVGEHWRGSMFRGGVDGVLQQLFEECLSSVPRFISMCGFGCGPVTDTG